MAQLLCILNCVPLEILNQVMEVASDCVETTNMHYFNRNIKVLQFTSLVNEKCLFVIFTDSIRTRLDRFQQTNSHQSPVFVEFQGYCAIHHYLNAHIIPKRAYPLIKLQQKNFVGQNALTRRLYNAHQLNLNINSKRYR